MNDDNAFAELGDRSPQGRINARRCLKNCVFVSHSGKDWPLINEHIETPLEQALSVATYTRRLGAWYYPYGIFCFSNARLGGAYGSTVAIALAECRAFVLVVSKNAMSSDWVRKELVYADKRFRRILVISVDDTSFSECASALGVTNILRDPRRVLVTRLSGGIPIETTNLLAVATEYFKSQYTTILGMKRPLGSPILINAV